uniref:Uncharacterized protein n=1 Tax=Geladintestivirus 1 TaxID=3233133 RepID=A0AAU8MJ99_9CAUD
MDKFLKCKSVSGDNICIDARKILGIVETNEKSSDEKNYLLVITSFGQFNIKGSFHKLVEIIEEINNNTEFN